MTIKDKTGIVIQVRSDSSRFKSKFKKKILNKSLIKFLINRCSYLTNLKNTKLIIAIPNKDLELIDHLKKVKNINIFQGKKKNVLDRFYQCGLKYNLDHIVRLTGDNPFVDIKLIKQNLIKHIKNKKDFTTNCHKNSFPNGLEFEIMTFKLLKTIWEKAKLNSEKEHVTPLIYKLLDKKKIKLNKVNFVYSNGKFKHLRLTVDKKNDLKLIIKLVRIFRKKNYEINLKNIIKIYKKNKKIFNINQNEIRDEGYLKSLSND